MARGDRTEDAPARVPVRRRVRQLLSQLGPARRIATLLFLLMAVLVARLGWQLPLVRDAERALYDARATAMAPHVGQDRRILLVTYNDETLFNTGIRSPLDRGILARALANIDAMGAKASGIDIVFDSPRPTKRKEHTSKLRPLIPIPYASFSCKKQKHN